MLHYISEYCKGENCRLCGSPATHKVEEYIPQDDPAWTKSVFLQIDAPVLQRHPFSAYVCCSCFKLLFGDGVFCEKSQSSGSQTTFAEQLILPKFGKEGEDGEQKTPAEEAM